MAERAHPDDSGFKNQWKFRLRRGIIPWWTKHKSPYLKEFLWRYEWVSNLCRNKDVLDIPCGMGWGTSKIRGTRSLIGLDISEDAIAEANQRYGSIANFRVGDMSKLDLKDSSIDVISCLEGIEHVPIEIGRKFLDDARRILRPEGKLLISSPYCLNKPHSGNPFHVHEYRPNEIKSLLSEFFLIETCECRRVENLEILYLNCKKIT